MLLHRVVAVSKHVEIQQAARCVGKDVYVADEPAECVDIVGTVNPDLVVFDDQWAPSQIREFVSAAKSNSIDVPVIVLGHEANRSRSRDEYRRAGAFDYLQGATEQQLQEVAGRIQSIDHGDNLDNAEKFFVEDLAAAASMVGRSTAIRDTLRMIKLVASSNCNPVLILGETGTGKELVAKTVHTLRHPDEQFVAVNCAALTANLLESELFGHVKGSFTSADREKTGLFELAGEGTIFLDEISEMPLELQAKLLRVLQDKSFRKVGGITDIACRATIIASSNRNLHKEVRSHRFRRDLYYRLNICPIWIAPLSSAERKSDIALLAEYFLMTSTVCPEKAQKITSITKMALETLERHSWPGNVRELRNVIERAVLLETTDKIGLSSTIIDSPQADNTSVAQRYETVKNFSLEKAERELIARALQETGWQKTRAAALLGITRATLYAKVKQHNIQKGSPTAIESREKRPGSDVREPVAAV